MKEELKAGIIVAVSMAILAISVIAISANKWTAKYNTYYVKLYDITGLNLGSAVMLGGLKIGSIIDIIPPNKPNEPITLKLGISQEVKLYEGMTAFVSQVGFVGDFILQISMSNTKGTELPVGATIASIEQVSFAQIMSQMNAVSTALQTLSHDVKKAFKEENLQNISKILQNTNQTIVNIDKSMRETLSSIHNMSLKADQVLSSVDGLIKDNEQEITDLIATTKSNLDEMNKLLKTYDTAGKNLDSTLKTAHKTLVIQNENIEELIRQLIKTTDALSDTIIEFNQKPWRILYKEVSSQKE